MNNIIKNKLDCFAYATNTALVFSLFFLAGVNYAQPGLTQQAIETIPRPINEQSSKIELTKQTKETPEEHRKALIKWLESPVGMAFLTELLKHPFLTHTAKSVYTPAATPMKWGGVGLAATAFNGNPALESSRSNQWGGGLTLALPLGDSDKIIGAAVAVSEYDIQSKTSAPGGSGGNISLMASRWLGQSTIVMAGVANLAPWGSAFKPMAHSYYGALTQMWWIRFNRDAYTMSASLGAGSGIFAPLGQLTSRGEPKAFFDNQIYPFVNLSFNLTDNLAVVGDYYSETFAAGISYNRKIKIPLSFMIFAGNLRHTRNAPSSTFGLRVSTGFAFPRGKSLEYR